MVQFQHKKNIPFKTLATVTTSFKALPLQRTQKKEIKTQMQILAGQNRIAGKDEFFRNSYVAQIKKCETNESWITTWGRCPENIKNASHSGRETRFLVKRKNLDRKQ